VQIAVVLVFDAILRKVHVPKFASEILIVAGYIAVIFHLLVRLGVNVTGIFATSAVVAAAIGLALQDMLANIAGGIALELEGGIRVGDFIRCGDWSGWVRHVRLRHTAIRTPDGDTVILPNSHLTRSAVQVHSAAHRHFVPFVMPYSVNPQQVIDAVEHALRASPLPGIAIEPAPCCAVLELSPGHIRYAAVVWLARPGHDTFEVTAVLTRVYFALQRAGMPASEITQVLEWKAGGASTPERLNPVDVLRQTPILRLLEDPDLFELASHLHHLSFAPGEHIIREGEQGSSMYFVVSGQVSISLRSSEGIVSEVSILESGDFFGEASLLTGEARNANAVALSRVDCYRLEKSGLEGIIGRVPDLAEDMSVVVAHRQMQLAVLRERLDQETARLREAENQAQLLVRIRRFFGLNSMAAH
jgi:CRP-like cAMP-binding protein